MTAPVASGWSGCRVGLAPTGKRRLFTAHAKRRTFSKPLVDNLKLWLEQQLARAPRRDKLAEAIRYALSRWHGLTRFLHDGHIELDTNPVERAIRIG